MKQQTVLVVGLLSLCASAYAQVAVTDPWVRATVEHQKATGAYMQLQSPRDTRLVEAKSSAAKTVEIHEMTMDNNIMKMRAVAGVDLAAGKPVELKPGGYHVMLMDLKQQIKSGDDVTITLVFEGKDKKRESVELTARARAVNAPQGAMKH